MEVVLPSDIDLLGDLDCVIDLDAEVANRALDLGMSKQELDRAQIASAAVDQNRLRPSQRVGAELCRIEPNAGHPILNEPGVLSRCQALRTIASTDEQELPRLSASQSEILIDGKTSLVCQLKARTGLPVFFFRMVARSMA